MILSSPSTVTTSHDVVRAATIWAANGSKSDASSVVGHSMATVIARPALEMAIRTAPPS